MLHAIITKCFCFRCLILSKGFPCRLPRYTVTLYHAYIKILYKDNLSYHAVKFPVSNKFVFYGCLENRNLIDQFCFSKYVCIMATNL